MRDYYEPMVGEYVRVVIEGYVTDADVTFEIADGFGIDPEDDFVKSIRVIQPPPTA